MGTRINKYCSAFFSSGTPNYPSALKVKLYFTTSNLDNHAKFYSKK